MASAPSLCFSEEKIDAIFAELAQDQLPGAAVGIAINGKPVYRKGFGLANIELPCPLSPSMRMRIYSTSKHFACLAYLLLCEAGPADIDDPVGKYLSELHPASHRVTVRQLMGHVSGLRDAHDICFQFSGTGHPVSSEELLSLYEDIDDANFAPGTRWTYNNGAYLILTTIIERIAAQSLEAFLRERIFAPVGMKDTLLRRLDTDFVSNSATMHTRSGGEFVKSYLGAAVAGEAGIVSTVDDMLRWLAHMERPQVGNAATWELMRQPLYLANGRSTGYALGLITGTYRGVGILHHGGGGMGANSQMLKVPSAKLDVVIMLNRDDKSAILLTDRILDACISNLDPVFPPNADRKLLGTFRSPTTGCIIEMREKDGRPVASVNACDIPCEWLEGRSLRPAPPYGMLQWRITPADRTAAPPAIEFDDFGNNDTLFSVPPTRAARIDAVIGNYRSRTTGTEVSICRTPEGVLLRSIGRFGTMRYALEPLDADVWRARPLFTVATFLGGILTLAQDGAALRYTGYRTTELVFVRAE
jgi:D-aminopeptidase